MWEHPVCECVSTIPSASSTKMVQTDALAPLATTVDVGVGSSDIAGRVSLSTQTQTQSLTVTLDRGTQACPLDLQDPSYFVANLFPRSRGFSCKKCKKVFYTQDILDRHCAQKKPCKIRFSCTYCSYTTPDRAHLIKHERTHPVERPFMCEHCQKRFAAQGALLEHRLVHKGEEPYKCSYCGKAFTRCRDLKEHMRSSHIDSMPYSCWQCPEMFRDSAKLRRHEREVHSGLYRFHCPRCEQGASTMIQLRSHMRAQHGCTWEDDPWKDSSGRLLHSGQVPKKESASTKEVVQGQSVSHVDPSVAAGRHVLLHQLKADKGGQHKEEGTRNSQSLKKFKPNCVFLRPAAQE